jgi:hypothetical protein
MLKAIFIFALMTLASLLPHAQAVAQDLAPVEMRFRPGQTSQQFRGTVTGYQTAIYSLEARGGDRADISLKAPKNTSLYYNIISPSGKTIFDGSMSPNNAQRFSQTLNEGGYYRFRVYLMRNDARRGKRADFTLNVSLSGKPAPLPPGAIGPLPPSGPSFDCRKARGTVETTICRSAVLSELDGRLSFVYKDAVAGAPPKRAQLIRSDQRTWLANRNICLRKPNVTGCLDTLYRARIAILEPK